MGAAAPWRMGLACLSAFSRLAKAILIQGLRSTHTKTGLTVLYAPLYASGKPDHRSYGLRLAARSAFQGTHTGSQRALPHIAARGPFGRSFIPPRPSPSSFSKNCFFHRSSRVFSRRKSTFCTNRAHKPCVSSQGFFSFCIQSQFFGISELYKLGACFIIYFSFFAMFNCLLYSQNFPGIS